MTHRGWFATWLRNRVGFVVVCAVVLVALKLLGASSTDLGGVAVLLVIGDYVVFGRPGKRFIREIKEMWETKRIV